MKTLILDANVLVQFLVQDQPEHAAAATRLMSAAQAGQCELMLDSVIMDATVYVLSSGYKRARVDVANALLAFIGTPSVKVEQEVEATDALHRYRDHVVDFADAWLAAKSASTGNQIASFDRDLNKFRDVKRHEPR